MADEARSPEQRKADVLAKLEAPAADCWVASASATGDAHLVPLSLGCDGALLTLASLRDSVTVRNLDRARAARLALGATRDVVMIDASVEGITSLELADPALLDQFIAQSGWDPRGDRGDHAFLVLRPRRVQAWREANEIAGRTVMRRGAWLV
jgi:hypothetical protein